MKKSAKIGVYQFQPNFPTKYSLFETIYGNAPVLKLGFLKIEFQM